MSPTELELSLIQVNKLLAETQRLLVEIERLKAKINIKLKQDTQMASEPPGTVYCDLHCV